MIGVDVLWRLSQANTAFADLRLGGVMFSCGIGCPTDAVFVCLADMSRQQKVITVVMMLMWGMGTELCLQAGHR